MLELNQLKQAVRGHIRDVASRGYIDTHAPTVPYVIVFIPSEQIYSLVLSTDGNLIDDALTRGIVLASPLTLYAMLSVMRQAAENANVMKAADEVMKLLGEFYKQWQKYNEEVDRLGKRLESTMNQYTIVSTTRNNALRRPLDKIEELLKILQNLDSVVKSLC